MILHDRTYPTGPDYDHEDDEPCPLPSPCPLTRARAVAIAAALDAVRHEAGRRRQPVGDWRASRAIREGLGEAIRGLTDLARIAPGAA